MPSKIGRCLAQSFVLGVLASGAAHCAEPSPTINAQGEVGRTSYLTAPFISSVYGPSFGASPGLSPAMLFWEAGKHFTDPRAMADALASAAGLTARGIVPCGGAQRWQDTYEAAQPASLFTGEPGWVEEDRKGGDLPNQPEFRAWVAWQKDHEDLFMTASDGGSLGYDFRKWGASYGHISPGTPLPKADWPDGIKNATYGDWYAYRWAQTSAKSGAYGIMLSDFTDSQPHHPTRQADFNPKLIDSFENSIKRTIPGNSVAERAAYIDSHLFNAWTDFICRSYAQFFGRLAVEMTRRTGHDALVVDQCGGSPGERRMAGMDERIIARMMPGRNILCIWENQTMSPERSGRSMMFALGGVAIAAAREPDLRNGANLSSDDPRYWEAVRKFWPDLSPADRRERGDKELKREWLETCWAHIATRQGVTRRALAFVSRTYWDGGKVDPAVQSLIQTIVPVRPFGFAVYYSTEVERRMETKAPANGGNGAYMPPEILMNFKNDGGVVNYYVSDAALPRLNAAARPAAWLVLDRPDLMPASELRKLKQIAPVLTSLDEARNFQGAPLAFSRGLTGSGFYDQDGRLIITASNGQSAELDGSMTLNGLSDGRYTATDLFSREKLSFAVAGRRVSVPIRVTRWDTRVFAITPDPAGR